MDRERYDLTQGNILSRLLLVALPIMGTQLMQMAYNLTDMFWLGRVGSDAVAASGTAGMYLWMSNAFVLIGRMGAEIGTAQSVGRGDEEGARTYVRNSFFMALLLGIGYTLVMLVFRHPLIGFFGIREQHVIEDSVTYLTYVSLAFPPFFVSGVLTGAFNGAGNSKTPFYINTIGLVFNMIMDPVLIHGFDMGVKGAAIATALAQICVCVLFLVAGKWKKTAPLGRFRYLARPKKEISGQIVRWSLPIGLENLLFTFLSMIISRFIAVWGAEAIAAQRLGAQIESMSWMIGLGFASALTAFVGQNYGAGKWSRIHEGFRISLMTILTWGCIVTLVLFFGGRTLFGLFLPDPTTLDMGAAYLRILAYGQLLSMLEYVAMGMFRGLGRTLPPSIASITCNAIRVPLAYFLSQTSLGLDGIWWGISIGQMLRAVWMFLWYLLGSRHLPRKDAAPNPEVQH